MSADRQGGRRSDRRAFRPGWDFSPLEPRKLLSTAGASVHTDQIYRSGVVQTRVALGGQRAKIRDTDFELYDVLVANGGTVRARPMPGGRVALTFDGTNPLTEVTINPEGREPPKGAAHFYPTQKIIQDGVLHIGSIKVTSGKIGSILGYRTANLSGPVTISGTGAVDRIAFNRLEPGAAITTGGDLNTLDVFTDLTLGGGPGISIGRDLNYLNVQGNMTVNPTSKFNVARYVGLVAQPAKGTDPGGQGGLISGNVVISNGAQFNIGVALQAPFIVQGSYQGEANTSIPFGGTNVVARGGIT